MRNLLTICFIFIALAVNGQCDTLSLKRDATLYANATLKGDVNTVLKYTYPSLFNINGGKSRLEREFQKNKMEMLDAGEVLTAVDIVDISKVNRANNGLYAILHLRYSGHCPGGVYNLAIPILALSDGNGKFWTFMETKKLSNPSVLNLFPFLDNIASIPMVKLWTYLENQKFSGAMVNYNRSFKHKLREFDLDFRPPVGYKLSDSIYNIYYDGRGGALHAHSELALKSADGILIFITFNQIDTFNREKLRGFPGPGGLPFDINRNWIPAFDAKYELFPTTYSNKTFNADSCGIYDFVPNKRVNILSKDEKYKVLFIHKENELDIEIMYFYTPETERFLKKHMDATRDMLKFKY
ncbi:hypothetical protein ACVWYN_002967 [Pedobacter sp. UYP24]